MQSGVARVPQALGRLFDGGPGSDRTRHIEAKHPLNLFPSLPNLLCRRMQESFDTLFDFAPMV